WQAIDLQIESQYHLIFRCARNTYLKLKVLQYIWFGRVGKGANKDAKARKLAFQHWIEAVDPRYIDMAKVCICIMKSGLLKLLASLSSTGGTSLASWRLVAGE
ncbi:hypothetical protein MKW92_049397, partial [Papaver armeniacum]